MSRFTDASHYGSYEEPMNLQPVEENDGCGYEEAEDLRDKIYKLNKGTKKFNEEFRYNIPVLDRFSTQEDYDRKLADLRIFAKFNKERAQEMNDELERL